MSLPPTFVSALIVCRDATCDLTFQKLLKELDIAKSTVPPPSHDLLDAAVNCCAPLPSGIHVPIMRRAHLRVLAAEVQRYRRDVGNDKVLKLIRSIFTGDELYQAVEREVTRAG